MLIWINGIKQRRQQIEELLASDIKLQIWEWRINGITRRGKEIIFNVMYWE